MFDVLAAPVPWVELTIYDTHATVSTGWRSAAKELA